MSPNTSVQSSSRSRRWDRPTPLCPTPSRLAIYTQANSSSPPRQSTEAPEAIGALRARLMGGATIVGSGAYVAAAEAAEQTLIVLGARLCALIGTEGYRALIARALYLATDDFPVLKEVQPALAPPGGLAGLPRAVRSSRSADGTGAIVGVLAALLWLLEQFIGQDLTRQIVGDVWPDGNSTAKRAAAR